MAGLGRHGRIAPPPLDPPLDGALDAVAQLQVGTHAHPNLGNGGSWDLQRFKEFFWGGVECEAIKCVI